jgi:hypothetical protein
MQPTMHDIDKKIFNRSVDRSKKKLERKENEISNAQRERVFE